jgi:S-adenosylmethionine:tRNA ribosyltransferase-isomerase
MLRSDFNYDLPQELIAQEPLPERCESRLLCLNCADGEIADRKFADLCAFLQPDDLLVFNDTRVIPARIFGTKTSGGKIEILVERLLGDGCILAQIGANKPVRVGSEVMLDNKVKALVRERRGDFYHLQINDPRPVNEVLEDIGHVPLPPYIRRCDRGIDAERYQTVYARSDGAVAAPTAGLHFDQKLINRIRSMGVRIAYVTLHVGAGTFQPVRIDDIRDHRMHSEYFEVSSTVCDQVQETRSRGGRVIAVGTTVVRCLESVSAQDGVRPFKGETDIFIYPGYEFLTVDAMITNFHMPESTLLMLVCAFAGKQNLFAAYRHAIRGGYRFYSYGDAMFIARRVNANR